MATHLGRSTVVWAAATCALLALVACGGGGGGTGPTGPAGPPGPPGPGAPVEILPGQPLPGIVVNVVSLLGATGAGGSFSAGNTMTVQYTVKDSAGADVNLSLLGAGEIYVSGPTSNYQRVIAEQDDLLSASTPAGGGVWSYTFATPIPATYLAPLNDSPSFTAADGELTGQPLLAGTYSVGLEIHQTYTVEGKDLQDAGADVEDFLLGGAGVLDPRRVVQIDNCNVCHTQLRIHEGFRRDVRLCVLCHTAGAEDSNVAGATPGRTIELKVMIHKLHNGAHLPSVLGVTTNASGARVYPTGVASLKPLQFVDGSSNTFDFSEVNFPVFPNFNIAMPRDLGYSALSSTDPDGSGPARSPRSCEDTIRMGVTACLKCHGDPDAGGPLSAPAQGSRHRTNPSRAACGSCHDDIDWTKDYVANGQNMIANAADSACTQCHADTAANQPLAIYKPLSVLEGHLHPLEDATIDPGVNLVVTTVTGGTAAGGTFQNGDSPTINFTLKNDAAADIGVSTMDSSTTFFLGNTVNRQLIMPLTSANGMTLAPYDFTGRLQATSSTNKGTMSKVFLGATAVKETLVVEFTSSTAFGVTGTTSGPLGAGALPAATSTNPTGATIANFDLGASLTTGTATVAFTSATAFSVTVLGSAVGSGTLAAATSASTRFTSPTFSFNLAVGTTAAVAGNTFNIALYRGAAANPVLFAVVAGKTAFASAAPAPDRFYYDVIPNAPSYSLTIPMDLQLEFLADSTNTAGQVLPAAGNLPVYFGRQQLSEATLSTIVAPPTVGSTTTLAAVAKLGRQVDVSPVTGFASGDTVVVESGGLLGAREYTTITPLKSDGVSTAAVGDTTTRIVFRTPLRYAHALGVTITKVTLVLKQEGAANHYTLNPATGVITSVGAFTVNTALIMTYRSDAHFGYKRHSGDAFQTYYVPPANDTIAIGQEQGDWQGLPYLPGTYTADIWLYKSLDVGQQGELQTYRSTSNAGTKDFLYGGATTIVPRAVISTSANCYTCHNDIMFHGGGRRGLDACLTCHSTSGSQNSLTGTSFPIEFRQMLHKIHMGEELPDLATYTLGNEGLFPALPGRAKQCARCHGDIDAWKVPPDRTHPSALVPVRVWGGGPCASCHSSTSALAHIAANTSVSGNEACAVCHGPGKEKAVETVHFAR